MKRILRIKQWEGTFGRPRQGVLPRDHTTQQIKSKRFIGREGESLGVGT